MECNDDIPVPIESQHFSSITHLCMGYPHGLGLYCEAEGQRAQRLPVSTVFQMYGPMLTRVCLEKCLCHDFGPEEPDRANEALNPHAQRCAISDDTSSEPGSERPAETQPVHEVDPSPSSTCSHSGTSSESYASNSECSEYWYGRPNFDDCSAAMWLLPRIDEADNSLHEYLNVGTPPQRYAQLPIVRTPIIRTHGA